MKATKRYDPRYLRKVRAKRIIREVPSCIMAVGTSLFLFGTMLILLPVIGHLF